MTIVSNTSTQAVIEFTTTEPFFMSPFELDDMERGIYGIDSLNVKWTLGSLDRLWSVRAGGGSTYTSIVGHVAGAPTLNLTFIQPSLADLQKIPSTMVYNYYSLDTTQISADYTFNPGQSIQKLASLALQLDTVPRRFIIYLQRRDSDQTAYTTDTFARIDSITVSFDNLGGQLSSCSSQELYKISARNGLLMSYPQWAKYSGSVLVLDVAKDIYMQQPFEAPGSGVKKTFKCYVDATNLNLSESIVYNLIVVPCYDGIATIRSGVLSIQDQILSADDVLNAKNSENNALYEPPKNYYGGKFFADVKRGLKKVHGFVKKHKLISKGAKAFGDLAPQYAKQANIISSAAKELGYGRMGGRLMTKNQLHHRMMRGHGIDEEDENIYNEILESYNQKN